MIQPTLISASNLDTGEPILKPPFPKQLDVIKAVFSPPYTESTRKIDLMCGWGFGKTTLGVALAAALLDLCEGNDGMFLEPDVALLEGLFLPTWEKMIPRDLYTLNRGKRTIIWKRTGSRLKYDHRNIRGSLEQTLFHFQGYNLAWVIDDEAASAFRKRLYISILARIRLPNAPIRAYITLTTPRMGEYAEEIQSEGHQVIVGKSEDNPYILKTTIDELRSSMSRAQARRDLDGELIALEDNIWNMVDLDHSWPEGSVDDYCPRFNPSLPYWILSDIGSATGAYAIVQHITSGPLGRNMHDRGRWVIVGEYCPQSDGTVRRALEKIRAQFGRQCVGLSAGADIDTRSAGDGKTPAYFVQKVYGGIPIYAASESDYNKHVQHDLLSYLFEAADGTRRLTICRDLVDRRPTAVLDLDSRRGIVEMIKQDIWPPEEERRAGDYMPKGPKIRVSHIRDALLMGASYVMRPPSWAGDPENR